MGGASYIQQEASPLSRLASWSSLCVCQCCLKHSLLQWKLLRMSQRPLRHRMHCMRASLSGWHQHTWAAREMPCSRQAGCRERHCHVQQSLTLLRLNWLGWWYSAQAW